MLILLKLFLCFVFASAVLFTIAMPIAASVAKQAAKEVLWLSDEVIDATAIMAGIASSIAAIMAIAVAVTR